MKKWGCLLPVLLLAAALAWAADDWAAQREKLVQTVRAKGVSDAKVLAALGKVERHRFVPEAYRSRSYGDFPLPIGHDQTISQPFIVGAMTQAMELKGGEKVLEIGTGSGYQAAVLAEITGEVYTIEIICELARRATALLTELGYKNIHCRCGDGYQGWPDEAPFDAIIVTAAPDHVPQPLIDQLKVGGRLVIPVGESYQNLLLIRRTETGIEKKTLLPVLFVPMTGPGIKSK